MTTVATVLNDITNCETAVSAGIAILDTAATTLKAAAIAACAILSTIGGLFNPAIKEKARAVERALSGALEPLTNLICIAKALLLRLQKFFAALKKIIALLLKAALSLISGVLNAITSVFNLITNAIKEIIDTLLAAVNALASQLLNWIKGLLTNGCGLTLQALLNGDPCSTVAKEVQDATKDAVGGVNGQEAFTAKLNQVFSGPALAELLSLDGIVSLVKAKINEAIQNFRNSITSAIDNMERACGDLLA